MKYSTLGYRDDSPDKNEPRLIINSNVISMKGVSKPIVAVPIKNGVPDYKNKKILQPNQDDYTFEGAEAVLEMPYAQTGTTTPYDFNNIGNQYKLPEVVAQPFPTQQFAPSNALENFLKSTVNMGNVNPMSLSPNGASGQFGFPTTTGNDYTLSINAAPYSPELFTPQKESTPNFSWLQMLSTLNDSKDLSSSLTRAGYGFGFKADNYEWASPEAKSQAKVGNTLATIGAVGNTLVKGAKDFLSGMTLAKQKANANNKYHEDSYKQLINRNTTILQEGGQVQDEKIITGNFTSGVKNENIVPVNTEVERGEYIKQPGGIPQEVLGKKHSEGGELMELEGGTTVVSDHLKIGARLASKFKRDFDINVKANNTFATVIDKYKNKIGLNTTLEEYEKVISKIKAQEDLPDSPTKELNLTFLGKKMSEIEQEKTPLDQKMTQFMDLVYQEQEILKQEQADKETVKKGGVKLMQEGGAISSEQVEQILLQFSEATGIPIEEVQEKFNSVSPEEKEIVLQEMIQVIEESSQGDSQSNPEGGAVEQVEQIVQAFAQATGQNPEQIIQQLQALSPEEQQAALQQMAQQLQGASQQQSQPSQQQMMKDGGEIDRDKFVEYINKYNWEPPYSYKDTTNTRNRLKYLYDLLGINYEPNSFDREWTMDELDKGFGVMQDYVNSNYRGLVGHYMSTRSNTKQDLEFYLDNGLLSSDTLKKLGVKVDAKGRPLLGIKEQKLPNEVDKAIYEEVARKSKEEGKEQDLIDYRQRGFKDNKAYYRAPELHTVTFGSQQDLENFLKEGRYGEHIDEIGDKRIYYSNKEGLYFTPKVVSPEQLVNEKGVKEGFNNTNSNPKSPILPWQEMNQNIPFPMSLEIGRLQSVSPINLNPVNVSPEPTLNEINRQANFAYSQINNAPDSSRSAQIANIMAMGTNEANKAIAATNLQNAQLNSQIEEYNENQVGAADKMNTELATNYTNNYLMAKAALEGHQMGWYNYMNQLAAQQSQRRWNENIAKSLFPNFRIEGAGEIKAIPGTVYANFSQSQPVENKQKKEMGGMIKSFLERHMFNKK